MRFFFTLLCIFCLFISIHGQSALRATPPKPDASDRFFNQGTIPHLKIEISKEEMDKLRQRDREYVKCTIIENDSRKYLEVGIHLKGAAGSFRPLEDRPALTLNFDKFIKQDFHGMDKLHLNNSVQDPSYITEKLCGELFLQHKVPTARTSHARVWLNGRDLGFYVLKEGYNKGFLKRHFQDATGNLYDGGFLQEIDAELKRMSGQGELNRTDLKALVAACRESHQELRWKKMEELIDIENFITFMALEHMTCHWDGYCQQRNNYRVYLDAKTRKAYFIPHGMDQMFGDPNYPITHIPQALVASNVMLNPAWRTKYRDKLNELMPRFVPETKLIERVEAISNHIQPELKKWNKDAAQEAIHHKNGLIERIKQRSQSLEKLNAVAEPKGLLFDAAGIARLTGWEERKETEDAKLEKLSPEGQPKQLRITAGPSGHCVASFRTKVVLPTGTYRFATFAKAENIKTSQEHIGIGAGIRISGSQRTNQLEGTHDWKLLVYEFKIEEPTREVELVVELRATAGTVTFREDSLKLVRVRKN